MARISAKVSQAEEWAATVRKVKALPRELKTTISRRGRRIADPLAREVRSAQMGSSEAMVRRMAGTTKGTVRAGIPTVVTGGQPYAIGAEFGGQRKRKTHYSTSRLGRRYIVVLRRSTMQFRQHRGTEGYEVYPAVREAGPLLRKEFEDLIAEVIGDL